ncbi:MAG TPA: acyltransferase [Patescibacteria group bacterium]
MPAIIKGASFGRGSYISPGYDFFRISLKGLNTGDNVLIGRNAWITILRPGVIIKIGSGTNIGRNVTITSAKGVSIGKKCLLSYNVSLLDHDHLVSDPEISPMDGLITEGKNIVIGDDCFIGAHSFILKGVTLGQHCVVAANSVVTKSFPDYSVIGGNPAVLIKNLKEAKKSV